ncbi:hypothetical protein DSCA_30320 [Desulfosarcina alkanivorans]|uniref:Uncharacterized protein n=1 Tax=Desulfosarcina alkanivorans TaxID=571177 RepID=A0A5K7YHI8_9BACT|nr:hypothetical protein [Desulfosarcina alkanivorans]BBO69102.1 hypothetical protein DSCA_30320 [Desulfosarcina alkanivorans]
MPTQHSAPTIALIGSAVLDATEAHEMLGAIINVIENRPKSPTEAQLQAMMTMVHEGLMVTRQRLQGLSYEKGSAFCALINESLSKKEAPTKTPDKDDDSEDRAGYLVTAMDLYLSRGDRPAKALRKATSDYAYEYHHSACFG